MKYKVQNLKKTKKNNKNYPYNKNQPDALFIFNLFE